MGSLTRLDRRPGPHYERAVQCACGDGVGEAEPPAGIWALHDLEPVRDPVDAPHDRLLVVGDGWRRTRSAAGSPARCVARASCRSASVRPDRCGAPSSRTCSPRWACQTPYNSQIVRFVNPIFRPTDVRRARSAARGSRARWRMRASSSNDGSDSAERRDLAVSWRTRRGRRPRRDGVTSKRSGARRVRPRP